MQQSRCGPRHSPHSLVLQNICTSRQLLLRLHQYWDIWLTKALTGSEYGSAGHQLIPRLALLIPQLLFFCTLVVAHCHLCLSVGVNEQKNILKCSWKIIIFCKCSHLLTHIHTATMVTSTINSSRLEKLQTHG